MISKQFNYKSKDTLLSLFNELDINIGYNDDVSILKQKIDIGNGYTLSNRMAIHPLEGCDGLFDGSPSDLTARRYIRYAKGGAGLVWFEAVAICTEGRANPRQLYITEENKESFRKLIHDIRKNTADTPQVLIAQLTHSGRYSKPDGIKKPICAYDNKELRHSSGIPENDFTYAEDSYLDTIPDMFVKTALLLKEVGFDGVDIKACHGYLLGELLSAYERHGKYGGVFENRIRLLVESFKRVREACGENFIVTSRLNLFDSYIKTGSNTGWGGSANNMDLSEPIKLLGILREKGLHLLNVTMGNPYHNPHVNRPYNHGSYIANEHPLKGIERLLYGAAKIKEAYPDIAVIGTGYSWFKQFAPNIAANEILKGRTDIMGMGRNSFAYPDFANDILHDNCMSAAKCCQTCSLCTKIMRAGKIAGCPVHDKEVYLPILREVNSEGK